MWISQDLPVVEVAAEVFQGPTSALPRIVRAHLGVAKKRLLAVERQTASCSGTRTWPRLGMWPIVAANMLILL